MLICIIASDHGGALISLTALQSLSPLACVSNPLVAYAPTLITVLVSISTCLWLHASRQVNVKAN